MRGIGAVAVVGDEVLVRLRVRVLAHVEHLRLHDLARRPAAQPVQVGVDARGDLRRFPQPVRERATHVREAVEAVRLVVLHPRDRIVHHGPVAGQEPVHGALVGELVDELQGVEVGAQVPVRVEHHGGAGAEDMVPSEEDAVSWEEHGQGVGRVARGAQHARAHALERQLHAVRQLVPREHGRVGHLRDPRCGLRVVRVVVGEHGGRDLRTVRPRGAHQQVQVGLVVWPRVHQQRIPAAGAEHHVGVGAAESHGGGVGREDAHHVRRHPLRHARGHAGGPLGLRHRIHLLGSSHATRRPPPPRPPPAPGRDPPRGLPRPRCQRTCGCSPRARCAPPR